MTCRPFFYRQSFSKHLWNLAASGFYARELDADDHVFLEYVRGRGIANGSLPNASAVLIEELEFWHLPYTIDRGFARRAGPIPRRIPETPEQIELRKARGNAWHARRIIREHEKAIAAAELEREQREWEKAEAQRKLRDLISDREWEEAAPRKNLKFGKMVGRHYVPQWKLDEERAVAEVAKLKAATKTAEQQVAAATKARDDAKKSFETPSSWRVKTPTTWYEFEPGYSERLKRTILALLHSTPNQVWEPRVLMHMTGCPCSEFMAACLKEMVRDGVINGRQ